jgi:hypothetical protein
MNDDDILTLLKWQKKKHSCLQRNQQEIFPPPLRQAKALVLHPFPIVRVAQQHLGVQPHEHQEERSDAEGQRDEGREEVHQYQFRCAKVLRRGHGVGPRVEEVEVEDERRGGVVGEVLRERGYGQTGYPLYRVAGDDEEEDAEGVEEVEERERRGEEGHVCLFGFSDTANTQDGDRWGVCTNTRQTWEDL